MLCDGCRTVFFDQNASVESLAAGCPTCRTGALLRSIHDQAEIHYGPRQELLWVRGVYWRRAVSMPKVRIAEPKFFDVKRDGDGLVIEYPWSRDQTVFWLFVVVLVLLPIAAGSSIAFVLLGDVLAPPPVKLAFGISVGLLVILTPLAIAGATIWYRISCNDVDLNSSPTFPWFGALRAARGQILEIVSAEYQFQAPKELSRYGEPPKDRNSCVEAILRDGSRGVIAKDVSLVEAMFLSQELNLWLARKSGKRD
jgi:hypothetical protein